MHSIFRFGILSISLPTDPGLLWRIGRNYIKLSKGYKLLKIADHEYEYIQATQEEYLDERIMDFQSLERDRNTKIH